MIWVSSDEKNGESEVGANLNGLLTCVCGTTTFMEGAVVWDSRDHGDPHRLPMPVSDPRQDTHTTDPNAPR